MTESTEPRLGIYLDDCAFSYSLASALAARGHHVVMPRDVGLLGADDHVHLGYAAEAGLAILTKNPGDFLRLHLASAWSAEVPRHAGILLVYQNNNVRRDMSPAAIVNAVEALLAADVPIAGEVHTLNRWRR